MRFAYFKKWLIQWSVFTLLCCAIMSAGRYALYHSFISAETAQQYHADVLPVFWQGLRFDLQSTGYLLAICLLAAGLTAISARTLALGAKLQNFLLSALTVLVFAATVGNYYYFSVYTRQFDVFIFGLAEEEPKAVLATIWYGYPVIRALIALIIAAALAAALYCALRPKQPAASRGRLMLKILTATAAVLCIAGMMRGSLGTFPLRQSAAQVSRSPQLNAITFNALTALKIAFAEHKNSSQFHKVSDQDGAKLIAAVTGNPDAKGDLSTLMHHIPDNPAVDAHKPNVVLAVMESMGRHLMLMDSPQNDMLGALREPLANDWSYPLFISEGDGTSDSLHRFFIRSPVNISQTAAKNLDYLSNAFTPYKKAGYRIIYITAGNGGWRDFDSFLRHLGIDEFIDENDLKAAYPDAPSYTWGVPDAYMFRMAEQKLQEADKTGIPVFIMMMSVTNHPPYHLPEGNTPIQYHLSPEQTQRLQLLTQSGDLNQILNTNHYSNDQLGKFIAAVKKDSPKTLIAAVGDHNMRAIGYPEGHEQALGHATPFYLHVPPAYRQGAEHHPERAGAQQDILPTLYELSLSDADYYRTGCNLTAPDISTNPWCGYGYNPNVIITAHGFYDTHAKQYYPWTNANTLSAAQPSAIPEEDKPILDKALHYTDFLNWAINRMVSGKQ